MFLPGVLVFHSHVYNPCRNSHHLKEDQCLYSETPLRPYCATWVSINVIGGDKRGPLGWPLRVTAHAGGSLSITGVLIDVVTCRTKSWSESY